MFLMIKIIKKQGHKLRQSLKKTKYIVSFLLYPLLKLNLKLFQRTIHNITIYLFIYFRHIASAKQPCNKMRIHLTVLLFALYVVQAKTDTVKYDNTALELAPDSAVFNDYRQLSGGYARAYNFYGCPQPYFIGNSYKVIDYWPDGANIEVTVRTKTQVRNGWTTLVVFSRPLPKGSRILVWNAEVTAMINNQYITFVNRAHNPNLHEMRTFSFTFVVEGASMQEMQGFSATIAFYAERIEDASCYLMNKQKKQAPRTTAYTYTVRPPARPRTKKVVKPTAWPRFIRRTTVVPRRTTRSIKRNGRKPKPRATPPPRRKPTTRPSSKRPKTRKPKRIQTTNKPKPRTTVPQYPEDMPEYKIASKMVQKHKGKCQLLHNSYKVVNSGYDAGNNLADGNGRKYKFNVEIRVPVKNVVSDWTVKIVFAEPIEAIECWEAVASEHSSDGTVWLIRPQEWNSELREPSEFLMVPLMRSHYAPPGIVYVCENGEEPTLLGNGIFERRDGGGQKLSLEEIQKQEQQEGVRQKRIQKEKKELDREREKREREERERERKERERAEKERKENEKKYRPTESSNNNWQNNDNHWESNNNNEHQDTWQRPVVTTTARPRLSGPRCSGRDGYAPVDPGQIRVSYKKSPLKERSPYDYNEVLTMSILFYEAQRSGKLPKDNRIPWRGDSGLKDGCDVGLDLTGGWYDAGDHVKFVFPMAWSATTLAWGAIEFKDAYKDANEYKNMLSSLKWVSDFLVKAHSSKYELYGQVGDGGADHSYWGKAEDMNMRRPAFKITKKSPGTELAGEVAAALAAISILFQREDSKYSKLLLRHAEELYEFADKYRGDYHKAIPAVGGYYRSYSGYNDELVWSALWLAKATGKKSYLDDGVRKYNQYGGSHTPKMFSWDDKRAGSQVLIAQLTGDEKYREHIMSYQNFLTSYKKTPKGMVWLDQWGSNRYAASAAFISLTAANLQPPMREKAKLIKFAEKQIHLMLGDAGRSYVVGYGRNPPVRPHHRSSSCPPPPSACDWNSAYNNPAGNHFTLYGALVGGPSEKGIYVDKRSDFVSNEVATDFNAGYQSALAGLKHFQIEARYKA
ncbi:uncharacterized protein LOC144424482 [Styela clava]